jgi:hypothetical protein
MRSRMGSVLPKWTRQLTGFLPVYAKRMSAQLSGDGHRILSMTPHPLFEYRFPQGQEEGEKSIILSTNYLDWQTTDHFAASHQMVRTKANRSNLVFYAAQLSILFGNCANLGIPRPGPWMARLGAPDSISRPAFLTSATVKSNNLR